MKSLLVITTILCVLGLLFVFESSTTIGLNTFNDQYYFLRRQSIGMVIGAFALGVGLLTPTSVWKKLAPIMYLGSIFALLLLFIPGVGQEFNGARRWISLFGISVVQPAEIAKLGMILGLSYLLSKHQRILPFITMSIIPIILILLQPDLGSTLLICAICGGMFFLAGGKAKWVVAILLSIIIFATIATFSSNYRTERFLTFINPNRDPLGASFHIRQITLALGRGGVLGQGIGNSRQKVAFIPEPSTDSIFAITAEEIGFVGSSIIIALYAGYIASGWKIAQKRSDDPFSYLLACGIIIWIAVQTTLNLAAIVALIPLKGMPLPFFSYGSSSLVMVLFGTGILARLGAKKPPLRNSSKTRK